MRFRSVRRIFPRNLLEAFIMVVLLGGIFVSFGIVSEMMLPQIVNEGSFEENFYNWLSLFLFWNILTNMVMCIAVDPSIDPNQMGVQLEMEYRSKDWHECLECQMWVPPRTRHCRICGVCVLKQDHHCILTGCCIGHHNYRYFIYFIFYIFVSSLIAFVVSVYFVFLCGSAMFQHLSIYVAIFSVVLILMLAFLLMTTLIIYKQCSALTRGATIRESESKSFQYDQGFLANLRIALGRWMILTWISPFIPSPLPHDGIHWVPENVRFGDFDQQELVFG